MGCDIHLYVEKRTWVSDCGQYETWTNVRKMPVDTFYYERYQEELAKGEEADSYWIRRWQEFELQGGNDHWFYDGRSYDLFAILADVRNGRGFAGVKTGEGFEPISMPKGLPENVSDYVQQQSDAWDCDAHSHSYHTVKDLLEYDWKGKRTMIRGIVGIDEYKTYMEQGSPDSWCGGMGGPNIERVDNATMEAIVKGEYETDPDKTYITALQWEISYYDHTQGFVDNLPKLLELSEDGKGEDVRIVFFFDN